ncbi:choice-of-anchor M domain-containing protein [Corynebacterium aquilae]|uniref:choice-of-anchor M domain-containing protein n=1 Tax=Corynebacterium aquilae TaxID=203263 RepID=UPI0009515078|nr:choice-of-anchor M domain-containing protein [Corynebacterium aquilae]
MSFTSLATPSRWASALAAIGAASALTLSSPVVVQAQTDPALVQTVDANEQIAAAGNPVAVVAGHFDFGPVVSEGKSQILIRDDSVHPPVWRHPNDTVFVLGDEAKQTLPGGGDYGFVAAPAGAEVWAIPQNQIADVPWLGWNTQAPSFLETNPQGLTLTVDHHTGPGAFSLFVQSGGFAAPQALVDATKPLPQNMWIEPNTHVHANWVFTEPGSHVLDITATPNNADGSSGEPIHATLRFAVGGADMQQTLEAKSEFVPGHTPQAASDTQQGLAPNTASPTQPDTPEAAATSSSSQTSLLAGVVFAVGALVLIIAAVVWARAKNHRAHAAQSANQQQPGAGE